jgi:hypothetical protein
MEGLVQRALPRLAMERQDATRHALSPATWCEISSTEQIYNPNTSPWTHRDFVLTGFKRDRAAPDTASQLHHLNNASSPLPRRRHRELPAGLHARAYGQLQWPQPGLLQGGREILNGPTDQQRYPSRFEFYDKLSDGTYALHKDLLADQNGCLHHRKMLVADLNGGGSPNIFVACHGYDAAPVSRGRDKVVLSRPNGNLCDF